MIGAMKSAAHSFVGLPQGHSAGTSPLTGEESHLARRMTAVTR